MAKGDERVNSDYEDENNRGGTIRQTEENSCGRCWYMQSTLGNSSKQQRLPKQSKKQQSGWKTMRVKGQDAKSSEDIRWEKRIMTLRIEMSHQKRG